MELKHVVDDTQMFGFERSSVIGSWVLSTNLTSNQDVALNPMSEVEVFDDGTAVISETFQLNGERPIDDEISPTENVIKTEADWILTTDGSLVIAALEGTHTTVLKPMKRVTDGSWRLMTRRASRNGSDENTFVGVTTAVKRNSGSVSSFLAQGDFFGGAIAGIPIRGERVGPNLLLVVHP